MLAAVMLQPRAAARMSDRAPLGEIPFTLTDDGTGQLKHVIFDEVTVGPYILPRVPGALSTLTSGMLAKEDIDGMIGNGFLKRFNMLIDFKSNKIYLQPNNLLYTQFYEFLARKS